MESTRQMRTQVGHNPKTKTKANNQQKSGKKKPYAKSTQGRRE
jgi:hypothetical protein